jgi:4-hydroxyphenylpyruvate dioxygenase
MNAPAQLHEKPARPGRLRIRRIHQPDPEALAGLFTGMGFTHLGNHKTKNVRRYGQGDINFILNMEPSGQAAAFRKAHGPSANGMAFRVKNARQAFEMAVERGATPVQTERGPGELDIPAIEGIGGSYLYLVDRYGAEQIYDVDFEPIAGAASEANAAGLHTLDHLTHNVMRGRMNHWAEFYERIFNFREIRYFDIEGKQTALVSRAMTAPDDKIRIPLNESQDEHSQIEEFLREYKGRGHPAYRACHGRHLRHRGPAARQRHPLPGQPRHLFRHDRRAAARPRP